MDRDGYRLQLGEHCALERERDIVSLCNLRRFGYDRSGVAPLTGFIIEEVSGLTQQRAEPTPTSPQADIA